MVRLADHAASLAAMTVLACAGYLAYLGCYSVADRAESPELSAGIQPNARIVDSFCMLGICPPPRVRLIHPRTARLRAPDIVCTVDGDPWAVKPCDAPLSRPASHP